MSTLKLFEGNSVFMVVTGSVVVSQVDWVVWEFWFKMVIPGKEKTKFLQNVPGPEFWYIS